MPISYDAEADGFHFSESKKSVTVFDISKFWNSVVVSEDIQQKNYHILEGKEVVEIIDNITHSYEGGFDRYRGNRAEITAEFYCSLVSIQMVFHLQKLSHVYFGDSNCDIGSFQKLDDKKLYLTTYIKADKIAELLPRSINRDYFMKRIERLPRKKPRYLNLNSWDLYS